MQLASSNPAKVFANGLTRRVRSLDAHSAEITVHGVRPVDLAAADDKPIAPADAEFTSANNVLQIDDPKIVAMAREAKGSETSPAKIPVALERYVHRVMTNKNFTQAFATAAEVAESREGDCTEHAVLLAALARACGIPSRVAIGLVYVASAGGFGYHMWTEMYLGGQWVPFDAVMGRGGPAPRISSSPTPAWPAPRPTPVSSPWRRWPGNSRSPSCRPNDRALSDSLDLASNASQRPAQSRRRGTGPAASNDATSRFVALGALALLAFGVTFLSVKAVRSWQHRAGRRPARHGLDSRRRVHDGERIAQSAPTSRRRTACTWTAFGWTRPK